MTPRSRAARGYGRRRGPSPRCEGARRSGARRLAEEYPARSARWCTTNAVPAARRHDPLGADDRRERQQGHAGAVRGVPDAARPRARGPGRARAAGVRRPASTVRRRRTCSAWRACSTRTTVARCRPSSTISSGSRASGARPPTWCARSPSTSPGCRSTRTSGGLARRLRAHDGDRSGEGRAGPQRARPAGGAGPLLAAADPARPPGVLRPQAELRRLRPRRRVSVGRSTRDVRRADCYPSSIPAGALQRAHSRSAACVRPDRARPQSRSRLCRGSGRRPRRPVRSAPRAGVRRLESSAKSD